MLKAIEFKIFLLVFVLFFALFVSGCIDLGVDCETYDYADCLTDEPETWDLKISLTINEENPEVKITVFKGDFDNGDTLFTSLWDYPEAYLEVQVNQEYSATAEYKSGGKKIIAVDGDYMKTKSTIVCEKKCWKVKGSSLDLKLLDVD